MPMHDPNPLTQAHYWEDVQLLSTEIEDAVAIFHTYDQINRLAVEDRRMLDALNEEALFWKVLAYSLQTSLFIALARIFDPSAHSIHKVISATLGHIEFFSKEALAARGMAGGPKPEWLDEIIKAAWAPKNAAELGHLVRALREHHGRFKQVYLPIRNKIFAHRVVTDGQVTAELFGKTSRDELAAILDFLHDLIDAIKNLYLNGIKPKLGEHSYEKHNQHIRSSTERVLRKLAEG